jgi:hypothetical protein
MFLSLTSGFSRCQDNFGNTHLEGLGQGWDPKLIHVFKDQPFLDSSARQLFDLILTTLRS